MIQETTFQVKTSDKFGPNFCADDCEHLVQYTKFPEQNICKPTGAIIEPDHHGRLHRCDQCRYIFDPEEVPERFWSPMKGAVG